MSEAASRDAAQVVVRDKDILGGRPVFRGTRVPVEALFDNLADGRSLAEIEDSFPTVGPALMRAALHEAGRLMAEAAPKTPDAEEPARARAVR